MFWELRNSTIRLYLVSTFPAASSPCSLPTLGPSPAAAVLVWDGRKGHLQLWLSFGKPMMPVVLMTFLAWYQNNPSLPTLRVPASWKPHSHFGALAPACSCGFGRLIAVGLCTQASLVPSAFSYHPALFWAKKYRLFFDNRPKAVFNKKTGILIKTR